MVTIKYKQIGALDREAFWTNEKCGHVQKFRHCVTLSCGTEGCGQKNMNVERLIGPQNVKSRVEYFVKGDI